MNRIQFRFLNDGISFINGIQTKAKEFAYDDCHKIYIIEDEADKEEALLFGYDIYPINKVDEYYENSCPLRFISNWKLTVTFVPQGN